MAWKARRPQAKQLQMVSIIRKKSNDIILYNGRIKGGVSPPEMEYIGT